MKKIKLGIYGPSGRMGQDILKQLNSFNDFDLVALCEKKDHRNINKVINSVKINSDIKSLINLSDVIIDFTSPKASLNLLESIKKNNNSTAIVSGTTGYSKIEDEKFLKLSKNLIVLRSFNMSIGVNLLKTLVSTSSKNLSNISDIEILEFHHNKKRDIPSGTAITLLDSIKEGNNHIKKSVFRTQTADRVRKSNEVGFSSIRGGNVVGEHTVFFFMDGERIELTHKADDRKIFSVGALKAAKWVYKKKPGLYTMLDMIS
ncbi:MAG: 4-hydroxy-tetrahydrodipicolinate reductase [Alphaproteobacteria bacterium]|jgi:4-hydroxy-tetrahydrodipicolinate reductase|nr:4-hydroxy-tetrahydrodipicolinate reductase [Alphaproteobacteria bacterium]|tara:strand:+ start:91 stop:870 length:780 start_codon:yes stop_codon:yes gene_type:complete